VEETVGLVDGDDATGRGRPVQQDRAKRSRAATDIQHGLTGADSGRSPGMKRTLAPRPVLQTEPLDLLIVRA
jgi:hypothetical protein